MKSVLEEKRSKCPRYQIDALNNGVCYWEGNMPGHETAKGCPPYSYWPVGGKCTCLLEFRNDGRSHCVWPKRCLVKGTYYSAKQDRCIYPRECGRNALFDPKIELCTCKEGYPYIDRTGNCYTEPPVPDISGVNPTVYQPKGRLNSIPTKFSWAPVSGADYYTLWIAEQSPTKGYVNHKYIYNIKGTSWSVSNCHFERGKRYRWSVQAVNSKYKSRWSHVGKYPSGGLIYPTFLIAEQKGPIYSADEVRSI